VTRPGRHVVSADRGALSLRVDGAPSYLTIHSVGSERVPAVRRNVPYHPLVARNENVAALPYGEVGDRVAEQFGDDTTTVDLRTAAQTLRQANGVLAAVDNEELAAQRDDLRGDVRPAVQHVNDEMAAELAAATAYDEETSGEIVATGMERWDSTATRALAQTNRSAAAAIASAAAGRTDAPDAAAWEDRVRTRLRVAVAAATAESTVRPPEGAVRDTATSVRERARSRISDATAGALQNASDQVLDRLDRTSAIPSGVPVTPVPGYWYATANAWQIDVSGRYARFTVRAGRDAPTAPGGTVAYSRDGSLVEVDVDVDGQRDRLGRSTRVRFSASTTVLVVVPPGRSGVGDVDGNRVEESPGWPTPGYDPTAM
jgi:hypothetical protein